MTLPHAFPQVSEIFTSFPLPLIAHLRRVTAVQSPTDAFNAHCTLLEWLTKYLVSLSNSVYVDRPTEQADSRLEGQLRNAPSLLTFGAVVTGLRNFGASNVDYSAKIPEVAAILTDKDLPVSVVQTAKSLQMIRKVREDYGIPPIHLEKYLRNNSPTGGSNKWTLEMVLTEILPFRNKGLGHQAEESWFAQDPAMYTLVVNLLSVALDALLCWEPMRDLLANYEIVSSGHEYTTQNGIRVAAVNRPHIAEGFFPLGASTLELADGQRVGDVYVAKRTANPRVLKAVVRYVHYPQTLLSAESLYQQYAQHYLTTYLEHGLITKPQRQSELEPLARRLSVPETERRSIEIDVQQAINEYASDDVARRAASLSKLASLLKQEMDQIQGQVPAMQRLPQRRKERVLEQITDNVIMNFEQLRLESELAEPDLDSVLAELEADKRVRRIGASASRVHAHFKAQDPSKSASFRTILTEVRTRFQRAKKYPATMFKLVELCKDLLADDGIPIDEAELLEYRGLFEGFAASDEDLSSEPGEDVMSIQVDGEAIQATSVRGLFEVTIDLLRRREKDIMRVVPVLIGRSRYLVNREPKHRNGTPFTYPISVGGLFFEANLTREQALGELIRVLESLGLTATSPDVEIRREVLPLSEESEVDEAAADVLRLEILDDTNTEPVVISGAGVSKFLDALLQYLIARRLPIDSVLPVYAGRVRYLLAEEPYHANHRRFDRFIEQGGYFMNTAFSYEQAIAHARALCDKLGLRINDPIDEPQDVSTVLSANVDGQIVSAAEVPEFLPAVVSALYEKGLLTKADIPYKSGRVRYLISESPIHDHRGDFIRPVVVNLGGERYYIEANVSRQGAVELVQRLLARKVRSQEPNQGADTAIGNEAM